MRIVTKLCKRKDCYRASVALGMCSMHYQRHLSKNGLRKRIHRVCIVDQCHVRRDYADGMCAKHHRAWMRGDDLTATQKRDPSVVMCPHKCGRQWHNEIAVAHLPLGLKACKGSPTGRRRNAA